MPLPKSLTTVTPFSKALALAIFILFPILAFFLGRTYQESVNNVKILQLEEKLMSLSLTPTPDSTANWKTFELEVFEEEKFSFKYPDFIELVEKGPETGTIFKNKNTNKFVINITYSGYSPELFNYSLKTFASKIALEPAIYNKETTIRGKKLIRQADIKVGGRDGIKNEILVETGQTRLQVILPVANSKGRYVNLYDIENLSTSELSDTEFKQILSTFKFLNNAPSPTCIPRPACLDAEPRCLIPESENMCPR